MKEITASNTVASGKQTAGRRVLVFMLCLSFLIAGAYYFAITKNSAWSSLLVMWSPGLAAICASVFTRRSWREIGWRPGPVKFLAAGWCIPIGCASLTYGIVWLTGLGSMPSPLFLERAALTLNLHDRPAAEVVLRAFVYLSTMGLLNIGALGEELGWRGFLVPELNRWAGFRRAGIISGAIWALWHWPLVIWGGYHSDTPLPYALSCLTIMTMSAGVVAAWLRLKSGSIWPCFVMHAVHNAMIQKFFDRVTINSGHTTYFTTEFGAGLALFYLLIAAFLMAVSSSQFPRDNSASLRGAGRGQTQRGTEPSWPIPRTSATETLKTR